MEVSVRLTPVQPVPIFEAAPTHGQRAQLYREHPNNDLIRIDGTNTNTIHFGTNKAIGSALLTNNGKTDVAKQKT
jgi:hypothetical protein